MDAVGKAAADWPETLQKLADRQLFKDENAL